MRALGYPAGSTPHHWARTSASTRVVSCTEASPTLSSMPWIRSARLHVGGTPAVHAATAEARLEGRRGPEVGGAGRHHIDVALQHQAAAAGLARRMEGRDVVAALIAGREHHHAEADHVGQRVGDSGPGRAGRPGTGPGAPPRRAGARSRAAPERPHPTTANPRPNRLSRSGPPQVTGRAAAT